MVASVFLSFLVLLTSCGVPTYYVPKFTVSPVTKSTTSSTGEFNLTYTPDATVTTGAEDYCGMVLLYYIGDSTNSESSTIISKFKSQFTPSTYNGVVLNLEDSDDPVITYTNSSSQTINVYAFTNDGTVVEAPEYNLSIPIATTYSVTASLTYNSETGKVDYADDSPCALNLGFYKGFTPTATQYIWIYAAVSTQGDSFSNIYWSDLKLVGNIVIPTT